MNEQTQRCIKCGYEIEWTGLPAYRTVAYTVSKAKNRFRLKYPTKYPKAGEDCACCECCLGDGIHIPEDPLVRMVRETR